MLLCRGFTAWPLHLDGQKPAGLGNTANDVGDAAGVRGDVATIPLSDARVLVLVAGDAAPSQVVQNLLLDVLFGNGSCLRLIVVESKCYAKVGIYVLLSH